MANKLSAYPALLVLLLLAAFNTRAQAPADKICGKWESDEKNLIVEVYRDTGIFKAKIVWFNAGNDNLMRAWEDKNNPDEKLRSRKTLGMNVLTGLIYKPQSDSWEDGMIYDAKHGRYWNASAYLEHGLLKVKGYWHFKFIGHTMTFNRVP